MRPRSRPPLAQTSLAQRLQLLGGEVDRRQRDKIALGVSGPRRSRDGQAGRAQREGYAWALVTEEGLDAASTAAQREEMRAVEAEAAEGPGPDALVAEAVERDDEPAGETVPAAAGDAGRMRMASQPV